MPLTYNVYTGDGVETDFTFNKPYIAESHVFVYVDDVLQTLTTHYSFPDLATVRFVTPPADTLKIEIVRMTSKDLLINFVNGAVFDDETMNLMYRQSLYILQELCDDAMRSVTVSRETFAAGDPLTSNAVQVVTDVYVSGNNIVKDTADLSISIALDSTTGEATLTLATDNVATGTLVIAGSPCGGS